MKLITALLTVASLFILNLSSCGGADEIQEQTSKKFQLNSHPKQAYRLNIKIIDAPGPLQLMGDLNIDYVARNCSYVVSRFEGVSANPKKLVENKVRQLRPFEYETIVHIDAMKDEDYFGQGVCHWEPDGFGIAFKAAGKPNETKFNFGDFLNDLIAKKSITKYYWKWAYPYSKNEGGMLYTDSVDFGIISPELYNAQDQKKMFTITIIIEKV